MRIDGPEGCGVEVLGSKIDQQFDAQRISGLGSLDNRFVFELFDFRAALADLARENLFVVFKSFDVVESFALHLTFAFELVENFFAAAFEIHALFDQIRQNRRADRFSLFS